MPVLTSKAYEKMQMESKFEVHGKIGVKKNECKQVHGQLRRTLHIPILYTAPVEPPVADVVLH